MSQTTYCTNCGKEISITARFCRFCGSPIRRSQADSSSSPPPSRPSTVFERSHQPSGVVKTVSMEKIPDSVVDALYARKRKTQIKSELKSLLKEVDELSKKVEIGLIDDAQSSSQTSDLQETMGKLQEEQKSLVTQPLDLESLTEEQKKWDERLDKLNEKKY